jgi:hypothetical protein
MSDNSPCYFSYVKKQLLKQHVLKLSFNRSLPLESILRVILYGKA